VEVPHLGRTYAKPGTMKRGGALTRCKDEECRATVYVWQNRVWCTTPLGLLHHECAVRLGASWVTYTPGVNTRRR
jgi:hypothetical protein